MEITFDDELDDFYDEIIQDFIFSDYKYIFSLIFLRYVNLKFEQRYNQLVFENNGFEEDSDFYVAEGILFLPEQSRWNHVIKYKDCDDLYYLYGVLRGIELESEVKLGSEIFLQYNPYNIKTVQLTLHMLNNISLEDKNCFSKIKYLYLKYLKIYRDIQYKINSCYRSTNHDLSKLLIGLLQPSGGRFYDPVSADGINFVEALKYVKDVHNSSFFGQESDQLLSYISNMTTHLFEVPAYLGEKCEYSLVEDLHPKLKADYIVFDLANIGLKFINKSIINQYTINYYCRVWIDFLLSHLSDKGKMVITVPYSVLHISIFRRYREEFVNNCSLDAVIYLPEHLYDSSAEPFCVLVINKQKIHKKVLLINAIEVPIYLKKERYLTQEQINEIIRLYNEFKGLNSEKFLLSKIIDINKIINAGYDLQFKNY